MKIGFWGSMHGQPGTTSNMMAASILMCACFQQKTAVLQTHFSMNNLSYPLIGVPDGAESFRDTGIDALLRDYKSRPLTEEVVLSDCVSLMSRQYSLFLGTVNRNKDFYEKEMQLSFNSIVDEIEKYNKYVFIDISSGYGKLSRKIAEHTDVLIINLSQNKHVIEEYFEEPIEHNNIIYVFGNYDCNSKYNIRNLTKLYPKLKHNCYCIYHNAGFMDAQNEGQTIEYVLKNRNCAELSDNYDFINSVQEIINTLKRRGDDIADS